MNVENRATLSRAELRLVCLLVAGLLCTVIGFIWSSHEATKIANALAAAPDDISGFNEAASYSGIFKSEQLRVFGLILFCPSYLVLLLTANRYPRVPSILKGLLVLPALAYGYLGTQAILSTGTPTGLVAVLFAILLVLPNRLLTRSRAVLFGYIGALNLLLALGLAFMFLHAYSIGLPLRSLVLGIGFVGTMASAVTLAPWLTDVKQRPGVRSAMGVTAYRWACILLLAAAYGTSLVTATAQVLKDHHKHQRLEEKFQRLERQIEESRRLGEELPKQD